MFRGVHDYTLDGKGRITVPARFREGLGTVPTAVAQEPPDAAQLAFSFMDDAPVAVAPRDDDRLILTMGLEPCLVAYPMAAWERFEAKLAGLSQFDPAVVTLKRMVVAPATEVALDKQGRLLVPPSLRDYAALAHEAVWAGMVTTFELWSSERWHQFQAKAREDVRPVAEALTALGL